MFFLSPCRLRSTAAYNKMLTQNTLRGRTAAITGASGGIGLAIARRFLQEGASIVILGRSAEKLNAAARALDAGHPNVRIGKQVLDVRLEESWERAISSFPKVDILVNCAGISQRSLLVRESVGTIRDILDTNLLGTVLGCKIVARHWAKERQRDGCIINLASLLATKGMAGTSVYSASKAGVVGLTTSLAAEFLSKGIRVNAILPGYIDTAMTNASTPDGNADADVPEKMKIPVSRFGTPEEVADAAAFLAKNKYANNCILNLDGGLSAT